MQYPVSKLIPWFALALWAAVLGGTVVAAAAAEKPRADKKPAQAGKNTDPYAWRSLFDGKSLKGWKVTEFGGEGKVYVDKGAIVLEMGEPMTGIHWPGKFPKLNYEVCLEAKRTEGNDFFATTTFPVGEDFCSFVTGGWGGTVVGLSSIDYYDASENETSNFKEFIEDQWYKLRIRVTQQRIECWIDDEQMVDLPTEGHKISVRLEVEISKPFGICSYMAEGHLRNIRVRSLKPDEVAAIPKD